MSNVTVQLKAIIATFDFPLEELHAVENITEGALLTMKQSIIGNTVHISNLNYDLSQIMEKTHAIKTEIERRNNPKLLRESADSTVLVSPTIPGKKRKMEICEIMSKRNKFIEEFQDKTIEASKFIKEMKSKAKQLETKTNNKKRNGVREGETK